jgi:hypothetical protein
VVEVVPLAVLLAIVLLWIVTAAPVPLTAIAPPEVAAVLLANVLFWIWSVPES